MNFIIEILPKKEKSNEFVFVVRAQNGFPISVCDSLDSAKDVIEVKFEELRKQSESNNLRLISGVCGAIAPCYSLSIKANIAHMFLIGRCSPKNEFMNCFVELVDCSTGEIYYNKNIGQAFNIGMPNDVGMSKIKDVVESAIRGARIKRTPLQLRLCFTESQDSLELPFQDINELKTPYEIKSF